MRMLLRFALWRATRRARSIERAYAAMSPSSTPEADAKAMWARLADAKHCRQALDTALRLWGPL